MKSKLAILLIWFNASVGLAATGGTYVGSGGDAVICSRSNNNPFVGTLSLDYLLTYRSNPNDALVKESDIDIMFGALEARLRFVAPKLGASFAEFREDLFNSDPKHKRIWREAAFGLIDIDDARIVEMLPDNCMNAGKLRIVQAAIRLAPEVSGMPRDKIVYSYVPRVINELKTGAPLQLAFLLIHEWLWDVSDDVQKNRQINRYLNSEGFFSAPRSEVRSYLRSFGISDELLVGRTQLRSSDRELCAFDDEIIACWAEGKSTRIIRGQNINDLSLTIDSLCYSDESGIHCGHSNANDGNHLPVDQTPNSVNLAPLYDCFGYKDDTRCLPRERNLLALKLPRYDQLVTNLYNICGLVHGRVECWWQDRSLHAEPWFSRFTTPMTKPYPKVDGRISDLALGRDLGCVLVAGRIHCFGFESIGSTVIANAPRDSGYLDVVISDAGKACAVHRSKGVVCWSGFAANASSEPVPPLSQPYSLALTRDIGCVVDANSGIQCWGSPQAASSIPSDLKTLK